MSSTRGREAEIAPILSRWAGAPDEPLTEHDRQNIALFVAFLYLRTPSASAFVQQHSRQLVAGLVHLSRTDPSALRLMREVVVASDPTASAPSIEELELALQREDPLSAIEMVPRVATLLATMPVESVFRALLRMQWQILVPPPGQAFWISDAATMVLAVDRMQIIVGGGIGLPGADVFVPLGARFALHASHRRGRTTRMIDHEEFAALKRRTVFYADRFVFSPVPFDATDPIVASASSEPRQKIDERAATEQWTGILRRLLTQR